MVTIFAKHYNILIRITVVEFYKTGILMSIMEVQTTNNNKVLYFIVINYCQIFTSRETKVH